MAGEKTVALFIKLFDNEKHNYHNLLF